MRNPVRSEADAFRLFLLIVAGLALIAIGAWIQTWLGVAVVLAEVVAAAWLLTARGETERPVRAVSPASPPGEHRVLVVADETVGGPELQRELRARAAGRRLRVLVVAPVPATELAQWTGDAGDAVEVAQHRLADSVESMRAAGLDATGQTGEIDPVQAVEDAVRSFTPDELVVATHPDGRSSWSEQGLPDRLRERFALPLTHVVVDLDADRDL